MPWARFDDNFPDHRKVVDLTDAAFRLLVSMICHCARNQTDGKIKRADIPRLIRGYKPKHLGELVTQGNVHEADHDCPDVLCDQPAPAEVFVHGYLERNRSKARIEADRAAAAKRKADYIAAKNAKKNGVPNGAENANGNASPTQPNPARRALGLGSASDDVPPPSPSAGDDEEGHAPAEVVKALVSKARTATRAPIPVKTKPKDCPCGNPWNDCIPSCPELARAMAADELRGERKAVQG